MNRVYLLIGGNIGDRMAYLKKATEEIEKRCGRITGKSSVYETAAWGLTDQPDFYNQVLVLETSIFPEKLMSILLDIEKSMGRVREQPMGPRVIDIDILMVEDQLIKTKILTAPHPRLPQRRFALTPLAEVAGNVRHPESHKTIQSLLDACTDTLEVKKIPVPIPQ